MNDVEELNRLRKERKKLELEKKVMSDMNREYEKIQKLRRENSLFWKLIDWIKDFLF